MPSPVLNSNWLNQNLLRNYPFEDEASRVDAGGQQLPNGLIADISLPVPIGTLDPADVFVQQVVGFATGVAISLADRNAPATTIASTTVFTSSHERLDSYTLTGQGALLGIIGRITLGDPKALLEISKASYDFRTAAANSRLVISCVRPYLQGVTGIQVTDSDTGETTTLTGIVGIEAGDNMVFGISPNELVLNSGLLDPGTDEDDDCGCGSGDETGTGSPIYSINGIEPDENGDFGIEGVDCTGVNPVTNGIEIVDTCSTPCCGCDQVDILYQAVQAVENEVGRLQEVEEQLRGRIDNMQTTLLNGQLNPPGGADEAEGGGGTVWFLPVGPGGYGGVWVGG